MKADPRIQKTWLRILRNVRRQGDVQCQKLDEGYYAVALHPAGRPGAASASPATDFEILRSSIPNLDRTRAVSLNFAHDIEFAHINSLRSWAGQLAAEVETGVCHAFAVVDPKAFGESVAEELRTAGWQVEYSKEDLKVTDGLFVEQVNLLHAIVRMVLSRSGTQEAQHALREEVARDFTLYRRLFDRFVERFQEIKPVILDHYFTASPDASCVAAGWDYWQVSGKAPAEADQVFEQAMKEFRTFLTISCDEWLPALLASACQKGTVEN